MQPGHSHTQWIPYWHYEHPHSHTYPSPYIVYNAYKQPSGGGLLRRHIDVAADEPLRLRFRPDRRRHAP